jgi:hypothetical protein
LRCHSKWAFIDSLVFFMVLIVDYSRVICQVLQAHIVLLFLVISGQSALQVGWGWARADLVSCRIGPLGAVDTSKSS